MRRADGRNVRHCTCRRVALQPVADLAQGPAQAADVRLLATDVLKGAGVSGPYLVTDHVDDAEFEGDTYGGAHDVGEFDGEVPRVELAVLLPFDAGARPDVDLLGVLTGLLGQVDDSFEGPCFFGYLMVIIREVATRSANSPSMAAGFSPDPEVVSLVDAGMVMTCLPQFCGWRPVGWSAVQLARRWSREAVPGMTSITGDRSSSVRSSRPSCWCRWWCRAGQRRRRTAGRRRRRGRAVRSPAGPGRWWSAGVGFARRRCR